MFVVKYYYCWIVVSGGVGFRFGYGLEKYEWLGK